MAGRSREGPKASDLPFTDAARRLLADARSESDRLLHEYVGTEHLVLALARQSDAAALLDRLGVDPARVRALIAERVAAGRALPAPGAERPYTSRTKKVFALAAESARSFGHPSVAVEHLLIGLLRERLNLGAQVLQHHGLTVDRALAEVQRLGTGGDA